MYHAHFVSEYYIDIVEILLVLNFYKIFTAVCSAIGNQ